MNIFIIESDDSIVIKTRINEILKKNNIDKEAVITYDMAEKSIDDVIIELDTYNFLEPSKVIVCENSFFLTSSRVKSNVEHHIKKLKNYILNPQKENFLILCCDKLSDRKEIKDLISSNVEILSTDISIEKLIRLQLEGYKMPYDVINYLVDYCLNDNEKILTSLEMLKNYKSEEKIITKEDIDSIILKSYQEDIFDLVNAIAKRNSDKAYDIYSRLIQKEKDAIGIIASIANQMRMLYTTKVLLKEGYNEEKIARTIGVKPRAISIANENSRGFTEEELLFFLEELADLDIAIKTGKTTGNTLFELFLLKL